MEETIRKAATTTVNKELDKARERVQDMADDVIRKGRESWEDVAESGEKALIRLRDQGEDIVADAEKLVRKHPAKAVGLALLAGTLLGAFLAASRRDA